MNTLDANTLSKAVRKCYDYPNYNIGCIFKSVGRKMDFLHVMHKQILRGNVPGVEMFTEAFKGNTSIRFQNGSKIETVLCSDTLRGRRYYEILLDFMPTQNQTEYLQTIIVPYMYNEDTDIEDDASELDEFLNGFTVRQEGRHNNGQ